jgi:hypothetical protein
MAVKNFRTKSSSVAVASMVPRPVGTPFSHFQTRS